MSEREFKLPAPDVVSAIKWLNTAEKLAEQADQRLADAYGGDGETSAYWAGEAIRSAIVCLLMGEQGARELEDGIVAGTDDQQISCGGDSATALPMGNGIGTTQRGGESGLPFRHDTQPARLPNSETRE